VSIDAIAYVKTLEVGDPTSRLLLWAIAENTFNDSHRCKVGQGVLAEDVGVSERTIRRRLDQLARRAPALIRRHRIAGAERAPDEIEIVGFAEWFAANRRGRRAFRPDRLSGADRTDCPVPTGHLLSGADRTTGVRYNKEAVQESVLSPPTPPGGSGGGREDHPLVQELIAEGAPEHVARGFLGWLLGQGGLQIWKDATSPIEIARQLCTDLAGARPAVLDVARAEIGRRARYRLPPRADILAAVEAAGKVYDDRGRAEHEARAAASARRAADPALAARSDALREALRAGVGEKAFAAWFEALAVEAVGPLLSGERRLTVSAESRFKREWIATHYAAAVAAAAGPVFGPVGRVDVVEPGQASASRESAA